MLNNIQLVGKTDNNPEADAQAQMDANESPLSAGAINAMRRNVASGLIRSIETYLLRKNLETKDIMSKMVELVNAFRSNGDADEFEVNWIKEDVKWILSQNHACVADECCASPYDYSYMDWYGIISRCISEKNVFSYVFEGSKDTLSEDEKRILDDLNRTRDAYYTAEQKFRDHFNAAARQAMVQLLIKYATTFQKLAPEWYKEISRVSGINQDNPGMAEVAEDTPEG